MPLRRTIAAIAVVAAGVCLSAGIAATPAGAAEGQGQIEGSPSIGIPTVLINEDFRGPKLHDDFTLLGHAGLTNAPDGSGDAPKLGHDRKDYDGAGPSPKQSDARRGAPPYYENFENHPGYLQLTDNNHDKVGGVIYNHPLPTSGGLDVTFEMYQYNSTTPNDPQHAADGIGFFISDGSIDLEAHRAPDGTLVPGAYGGSLGYAQKRDGTVWTQGVIGGYLGVGFDVLGNYIQDEPECRGSRGSRGGTSCPYVAGQRRSPAGAAWGGNVPNTVTLRGPAIGTSGLDGYEYLASTIQMDGETVVKPNGKPVTSLGPDQQLGEPLAQTPETAARLVRVTLTAETLPEVAVYIAFDASPETLAESDPVLTYKMTDPMPPTFKFGFTGSTGDMTDVHLIRTLEVSTLQPIDPEIKLDKEAVVVPPGGTCAAAQEGLETAEPSPASYREGEEVCYRFTVTNVGDIDLTNVRIADALIGMTDPTTIAMLSAFDGEPGGSDTAYFYAAYEVTRDDVNNNSVVNTATAIGDVGSTSITDEDTVEVPTIPTPGILLEKTVAILGDETCGSGLAFAEAVLAPGASTPVCYRFHVTNTGNNPLAISLADDTIGFTVPYDTTEPHLQPGDSVDFYSPHTVAGADTSFVNTAHVEGIYEGGEVSDTDDATVNFALTVPLPTVGGSRDAVGIVALLATAALTVYLLDISRRRRDKHVL